MNPPPHQDPAPLSANRRSGGHVRWIGVRAGVVGWLLASPVLAWAVACASPQDSLNDIRPQLSLSCAALAVAIAVAVAARKVHFGSALLGVAVSANAPNRSSKWQLLQFSRWASPLLAINAIAVSASASALGLDWNTSSSDTDHSVVFEVVVRASSEAVLLCAIGVLAARVPKHGVTHLALALSLASFWRGHLLYPVASSANPIATAFNKTSPVGAVDEAGRAAWWGSPSIACVLLAAGVLSAWLATTARPSSQVTHPP